MERVAEQEDISLWRQKHSVFKVNFSLKDTWNQIREEQTQQQWAKCIWFSNATPKYTFLTWLAIQNRLATFDRIKNWSPTAQTQCVFCPQPLETRNHLFFDCPYATEVWKGLAHGLMQNNFTTFWPDILLYIQNTAMDYDRKFILKYVFQAAVYGIWRERNLRKHGEKPSPPSRMLKLIDKIIRNRLTTAREIDPKLAESLVLWFSIHPHP